MRHMLGNQFDRGQNGKKTGRPTYSSNTIYAFSKNTISESWYHLERGGAGDQATNRLGGDKSWLGLYMYLE